MHQRRGKAGGLAVLAALLMLAGGAGAEPPAASPRPLPRPAPVAVTLGAPETTLSTQAVLLMPSAPSVAPTALAPSVAHSALRPRARPAGLVAVAEAAPAPQVLPPATQEPAPQRRGLLALLQPKPRPADLGEADDARVEPVAAVRVRPGKTTVFGKKGSVCGVAGIRGETLPPIKAKLRGCGLADPVRVTAVDGVALTTPATMDCDTARALHAWVEQGLKPAFGRKEVASLQVAASYVCRPRNNIRGAPVSEHGRGKAIDISAINLADGSTVSVAADWRRSAGRPMQRAYDAACGPFGTTLGPDADRHHRDHMHFDTAAHRNGPYCK